MQSRKHGGMENITHNRNLLRLTSFPQGRTEQCFGPDSASLVIAEQVDSDEYNKNKVWHKVRPYMAHRNQPRSARFPQETASLRFEPVTNP